MDLAPNGTRRALRIFSVALFLVVVAGQTGCPSATFCPPESFWDGFTCICDGGLAFDGFSCADPSAGQCLSPDATWNGTECVCAPGFSFDGFQCVPIVCPPNSTMLAAECFCDAGFVPEGFLCLPIDCPPNSTLMGTECFCAPGFEPNGFECVETTENSCIPNSTFDGIFCVCNPGFVFDGTTCSEVSCPQSSYFDGSTCRCNSGFIYDGSACIPFFPSNVSVDTIFGGLPHVPPSGPTLEFVTVQPSPTPFFVPPCVGFGDCEFAGHGPDVRAEVSVSLANSRQIVATVSLTAVETRADWTRAQGTTSHVIYEHSTDILEIILEHPGGEFITYTDSDHDIDVHPGIELVDHYEFVGDTKGDDAGIKTGVKVFFSPLQIRAVAGGESDDLGSLLLTWMGVVDNAEGTEGNLLLGQHGPHGNIYFTIWDDSDNVVFDQVIPGATWNKDKYEWVDGDARRFDPPILLHNWDSFDDRVYIRVWESDSCGPFQPVFDFFGGGCPGREHDTIAEGWLYRRQINGSPYVWSQQAAASDAVQITLGRDPEWLRELQRLPDGRLPTAYFQFRSD